MGDDALPFDVRRAGVLLHVTSLPRADGRPGDLGDAAYAFVDFLADAGCSVWQVLPLVPTHEHDGSPYNALSTMAGNATLISAARRVAAVPDELDFASWCAEQAEWLEPYVEFVALRELHDHAPWLEWPEDLRDRDHHAVAEALQPC